MLFMLIRTLLWFSVILLGVFAVHWLSRASGGVVVDLNGRTWGPFYPLEFVAIVLVLALLIWLGIKLFGLTVAIVRFLSGDETAISRFWGRSRERRGFDALASGMAALAGGDAGTALTRARKAERLLDRPGLTRLLVAQSAEASGDRALAQDYYKKLAAEKDTSYVGIKGLLDQAMAEGRSEKALKLARHAYSIKPKDPALLATLFDLQCEAKDWEDARRTLADAVRYGVIPKDVAARREAVLLVADARALSEAGEAQRARDLANRAHKKSPDLVPATLAVAASQKAEGGDRKAAKTLRDAWRLAPHPEIAAAFADLQANETPSARRKRFQDLIKTAPNHAESRMLTAELALADNDPKEARKALGDLAETAPSARALALMAAIEKSAGGDEALVQGWLAKAVAAPRNPQWTCTTCGTRHGEWSTRCTRCASFDTLEWREGEADKDAGSSAMLPLLTEAAAPKTTTPPAAETPTADGATADKPAT